MLGALLLLLLAVLGCNRRDSFDAANAPRTEGEKRAASDRRPPGWVYVKTLSNNGRVLEEGWEFKKPPDLYEKDGRSHLRPYVDKLLASPNWFSSVTASTIEGDKALSVYKMEGKIELHGSFPATLSKGESIGREICQERGFPVAQDYLTGDGGRVLSWLLPKDPRVIVEILNLFAEEVHEIPAAAGMEITFEEHPDERHKHQDESGISFLFTYPIEDPSAPPPR